MPLEVTNSTLLATLVFSVCQILGSAAAAGAAKPVAVCGNGVAEAREACDGSDLKGATCESKGFPEGGTLSCSSTCRLDTTGCFACGNGVAEGSEQCDGSNLAGQTCESLGFVAGTLSCGTSCQFDTSACTAGTCQAFPATGQTTVYAPGDDGDVQAGAALSFTDNGDGTITDLNTGLTWEKKGDDGGLHDKDNQYVWSAIWDWIADVNAEGGTGFAGHSDWRIPNVKELQSIVDYSEVSPALPPAFNTGCVSGCPATSCSCADPGDRDFWSSTNYTLDPSWGWIVNFHVGNAGPNPKWDNDFVRAVRGPE